ncbi:hypothetical protein [Demequina maris]|uniref:hypothetical protein n=1 Tax=Demequina maris TaxID=1638982 RepID=UPI0007865E59|nr:hypothetical protein [Demequina maris]
MSADLEDALARRARAGIDLYDARSLASPVHGRVRRRRTVRGLGTGAVATVVVLAGALGAVALGSASPTVDPATTSPSPSVSASASGDLLPGVVTAEDLLGTVGGAGADGGQRAYLCTPAAPRQCDEVTVGQEPLLEIVRTGTSVEVDAGHVAYVMWTVRNAGDQRIRIDKAWETPVVVTESDAQDPLATLAGLGSELPADPVDLAPGDASAGAGTIDLDARPAIEAGTAVNLEMLVPIPFADPTEKRELWLRVTSSDWVNAAAVESIRSSPLYAEDLREGAVTRHSEDYDLGSAQTALDCVLDDADNPRTSSGGLDPFAPRCEALVVDAVAPLLTLTEATFDVDEASGTLTVRWIAQNTSGKRLRIDTGGASVAIEDADDGSGSAWTSMSSAGSIVSSGSLWTSDAMRKALLRSTSVVETVEPWQLFAGSATLDLDEAGDFAAAHTSVQVRVASRSDLDGSRELVLEVPWNG